MKFTFSFQRASCAKSWNMTAKKAENDARTSQVDQFAVVTARPKLERDQLSPHGWRARDTFAVYWAKRVRSQQKKKCYGVVSYECVKLIMYSDDRRSIAQQTSKTKFVRSKISYTLPVRWQLTTFPVSAARWRQQTDQLGRSAHHFPLFWPSYFNFLHS